MTKYYPVGRQNEKKEKKKAEPPEEVMELLNKVDFEKIHKVLSRMLKISGVTEPYNLLGKDDIHHAFSVNLELGGSPAGYDSFDNIIKIYSAYFFENEFINDEELQLKVLIGLLIHEIVHAASPNKNHSISRNGTFDLVSEGGLAWRMQTGNTLIFAHDMINEAITEYITGLVLAEYFDDETEITGREEVEFDTTSESLETRGIIESNDNLDFFETLTESIVRHNSNMNLQDLRNDFVKIYFHPDGNLDDPKLKKEIENMITPEVVADLKGKFTKVSKDEDGIDKIPLRKRWARLVEVINASIAWDDQW